MKKILELKDIKISLQDKDQTKEIIHGINLTAHQGETCVIMGPNGSGKSTLASGLMGHPLLDVTGTIMLDGEDISTMGPDERSKKGLFLSFQYPHEIAGVTISNFLRTALNARRDKTNQIKILEFNKLLKTNMELLHIPEHFAKRYVNEGFSGGEKKKMEILQLAMLGPKVAILDETDSGLDIDALRKVCESINTLKEKNPHLTIVVITHYQRMLNYLKPDNVVILLDGQIVKTGGPELAHDLEKNGYETFRK